MQKVTLKAFPLSLQQARLWSLLQESQVYRAQCLLLLEGELDREVLQRALQHILNRHDILRTLFYPLPGMEIPMQIVASQMQLNCATVYLEHESASHQDKQIDELWSATLDEPFDLVNGPLVRFQLLCLAPEKHLLLLSLSALSVDAATIPLFLTELCRSYTACLHTQAQGEIILQYADVSAWQNDLLQEDDAAAHQAYWQQFEAANLDTVSASFERVGAAKRAGQSQIFTPMVHELTIEATQLAQLREQAQQAEVTPEVWLLTCWQLLLWRLTNTTDMTIGLACDGRDYTELADALGLYTHFVPFNVHTARDITFAHILSLAERTLERSRQEQAYFMLPPRTKTFGRSEIAFFPISFEWEQWPDALHVPGLRFSLLRRRSCSEPFTLKLTGLQLGQHLQLELSYDQAHLSTAQVQRIGAALLIMLEASLAQPQSLVGQLPLLSTRQQHELLLHLQGPRLSVQAQSFQQLFAEQVHRHPTNPALVCGSLQLSYQQLDVRATHLAHALRLQGVDSNVLVALCLPRSAEMIVGLLAILKAHGAYLPQDPETPLARLSTQWTQSQARLLLTQQALHEALSSFPGPILCLDAWMQQPSTEMEALPPLEQADESDQLAYVIYTSGSTGGPKGVVVQQRSVVNYTQALCTQLEAQAGWHYATVSTLAADLGNTAIFCALASGGCLHVLPYDVVTDGNTFAHYLLDHPIDVLKIVPSHLSALLTSRQGKALLPQRWLILGGEALSPHLLNKVRQSGTTCQVLNHYGPTEATIGALVNSLGSLLSSDTRPMQEQEVIPLGSPIANMACCILDPCQQLLPVGTIGELYLSGIGLAWGYLGQPEQTQQRFIEHPWQPGERLYRTGDLAYVNEEGLVVYAGRADQQVKLRGYRIELEEIEATLRAHEQVREAVVVVREDGAGEKRLVAYVVGRQLGKPGSEDVKQHLRATLPEYMVPATVVLLRELPLTRNGKVDRQHLITLHKAAQDKLVIAEDLHGQQKTYVEPRDKLEVQLQHIWEELLDIQPLSVTDNFFDLGGHSILAVRMVSRIQKEIGQNLAMGTLFQYPTIAELAVIMRKNDYSEISSTLVPLQPQGSKTPFFCIHPSGGTVFRYANLARYLGNDQPFYGLQSPDLDGQGKSFSVLKDLAAHYIGLIQTVQPDGPYLLGGWSWGGVVAFEMSQQLMQQGQEVALLVAIDSVAPVHNLRPHEPLAPLDASDTALAQEMIKYLSLAVPDEGFASRPAEEQFQYALENARVLNTIPVDVNLEQLRSFARMLKTNTYAVGSYLPAMYPYGITLLRASEEVKSVGPSEDPDAESIPTEQRLRCGWDKLVLGEIDLHMIPGIHANLVSEPNVRFVAETLKKCIDQALAKMSIS